VIKEQVDQARVGNVMVHEKQQAKQVHTVKDSRPESTWIYLGVGIIVIGCLLLYRRLH